MRTSFAIVGLLLAGCASVVVAPDESDVPAVRLLRELDRGEPTFELTDGMRGVFPSGLKAFGDSLRSSHGALRKIRLASHRGNAWDVDTFYENSPFAERMEVIFDDDGRLAGFWYRGAGSGLMTEAELSEAFNSLPGQASAFVQAAMHREIDFGYRASEPQSVASQFKVMLLARACTEVGNGKRSLTDRLSLPAEYRGTPSCVLCKFDPGLQPTLRDYLHLLVSDSDNTSADFLRDTLGIDAITHTAQDSGIAHVPPLITTEGLFALECGLGPVRAISPERRANHLAEMSPDDRVASADSAAHEGFGDGPEKFGKRCDDGHSTADSRKATAHVVDWPMRADELVALYANAQLGQLDSLEASRCFLHFMEAGGPGSIPIGDRFLSAGSKNGIETDVRSVGIVVESDRGPIAVSLSAMQFPDAHADEMLGRLYEGAHALVEWAYARLPPR